MMKVTEQQKLAMYNCIKGAVGEFFASMSSEQIHDFVMCPYRDS